MNRTIHGVLERNARKYSQKEAFITSTNRLTYDDINAACNQLARYFLDKGIERDDRIAILAKNNEHFFHAYFALMKIGAIPAPVNIQLTATELSHIFHNHNIKGLVHEKSVTPLSEGVAKEMTFHHIFTIEDAVEASAPYDDTNLDVKIDSQDVCEILFTSGTTGVPKGVLFNHERILAIASAVSINFKLSSEDKILTLMPLTHSAPINTFFMSGFYLGCSHVIGDFTPKSLLEWIDQEKTTFTFCAPVAYLIAAKDPELQQYDLSSMRIFAYGGGPLALAAYERVKKAFQNENFYQVYGLTETGPNGILLTPEEHLTKAGSIGKYPTVNMEIKIMNEDGKESDIDEYGEILFSGDSLMLAYDNKPEETEKVLRNGWVHTGDIAYRDADGYMYIVDRKKDVIISGGVNIYPREIEEVLARHEAILEACVVGVPHEDWGETVKAYVVPNSEVSKEELEKFAETYLAHYKCPKLYEFMDALPRNASGKILKQELRKQTI